MNVGIYLWCKQKILISRIVSGENTDCFAAVVAQSALVVESPFGIETDILTHNGGKNTGKNWNEGVSGEIKLFCTFCKSHLELSKKGDFYISNKKIMRIWNISDKKNYEDLEYFQEKKL